MDACVGRARSSELWGWGSRLPSLNLRLFIRKN